MSDLRKVIARIEADFDFQLAVASRPEQALSGYELSADERAAFADPSRPALWRLVADVAHPESGREFAPPSGLLMPPPHVGDPHPPPPPPHGGDPHPPPPSGLQLPPPPPPPHGGDPHPPPPSGLQLPPPPPPHGGHPRPHHHGEEGLDWLWHEEPDKWTTQPYQEYLVAVRDAPDLAARSSAVIRLMEQLG